MKTGYSFLLAAALVFLTTARAAKAHDPIGGGPASSLEATVLQISLKQHRIDFSGHPPGEVLQFIARKLPDVTIDASQLKLAPGTRVKVVGNGWTMLQAASIVAEQVEADLLIQPGRIVLVPRAAEPKK